MLPIDVRRTLGACALLSSLALLPCAAHAGGYDEAVSGDLSGVGTAPTPITLGAGSNVVSGTVGRGGDGTVDRDYFSFTLPAGSMLTGIITLAGTTTGGTSSFIGVQAGSQVTVNPTAGTAVGLLGWWLYGGGTDNEGVDLLPLMGANADLGATGFTAPLGAGTYSFWIQETVSGAFPYHFDFTVSAVPEPAGVALWGAGAALLAGVARRRRRG